MNETRGWLRKGSAILALLMVGIALLLVAGNGSAQEIEGGSRPSSSTDWTGVDSASDAARPEYVSAGGMVLIVQDQLPWSSTIIQDILTNNSISYDTIPSTNLTKTDLSVYFMVIVPGDQPNALYTTWNANIAKIEDYVSKGGRLWLSAANHAGQPEPRGPGGVMTDSVLDDNVIIAASAHPWVSGLVSPLGPLTYATHGNLTNLYPNSLIVTSAEDSGEPTMIDYGYGYGRVAMSSMPLEWGANSRNAIGPILEKSLLNMVNGINLNVAGLETTLDTSHSVSLGAAGDAVNWSLDVFTGGGNVLGNWFIYYDWDCDNPNVAPSIPVTFYANGTMLFEGALWSWSQTENKIVFISSIGTTYSGYIAGDIMGGTMFSYNGLLGCWEISRAALGVFPGPQREGGFSGSGEAMPSSEVAAPNARFSPDPDNEPDVSDWLTVTPGSGSLSANNVSSLSVEVAAERNPGSHYGLVRVRSNDPDRASIFMPVSLPSPRSFLSLMPRDVCLLSLSGRESEPNEARATANKICIGLPVTGFPNDSGPPGAELDYYEFYWNGQGTLQVDLTGFVDDGQLILYHVDTEVAKHYDDVDPTVIDYQIIYNGAAGPGLYRVLANAGAARPTPGSDYTLLVTVH